MTVAELIELLRKEDPNKNVEARVEYGDSNVIATVRSVENINRFGADTILIDSWDWVPS